MARFWSQKEGLYDSEWWTLHKIVHPDEWDDSKTEQFFLFNGFLPLDQRKRKGERGEKPWAVSNSSIFNNNAGNAVIIKRLLASESLYQSRDRVPFHDIQVLLSASKNPSKSNEWTRSQCSKMPQGDNRKQVNLYLVVVGLCVTLRGILKFSSHTIQKI